MKVTLSIFIISVIALSGCLSLPPSDQEKQRCVQRFIEAQQRSCEKGISITAEHAVQLINPAFVDNRTTEAISVSILPNATGITNFQDNPERFRNRPIVLYDYSGTLSCSVAEQLRVAGFDAYALAGGVLGWAWSGRKFVHDGEEVSRVHVYKKKWALLPADYTAEYNWWMPWWMNSRRTGCS